VHDCSGRYDIISAQRTAGRLDRPCGRTFGKNRSGTGSGGLLGSCVKTTTAWNTSNTWKEMGEDFCQRVQLVLRASYASALTLAYRAGRSKHWLKLKNGAHPSIMRVKEAFELERERRTAQNASGRITRPAVSSAEYHYHDQQNMPTQRTCREAGSVWLKYYKAVTLLAFTGYIAGAVGRGQSS
jgi:hypothetical protein